ncbi:MAG: fluoride efflux transporter FluC, partial [Rhodospirillales bacterium]
MSGAVSVGLIGAVAAGGAVGAVARYLVMSWVSVAAGTAFPWSTLAVNALGSAVMGGLVELSALYWSPSPELRAALFVGLLGAFTTFSTFSLDLYLQLVRGEVVQAGL